MTAFNPLPPRRAAELIRQAGIDEPHRVLADFASAGIVRSYARSIVTGAPAAGRKQDRDLTIPAELWRHIIDTDKVEDVFARASVELFGPGTTFGQPHVAITGIRFNEDGVLKLVSMHGGPAAPAPKKPRAGTTSAASHPVTPASDPAEVPQETVQSTPAPSISPDATLITVEQAAVMIGCGRTKAWDLVAKGELVSVKSGKRMTRVTIDSVRAWIERHKSTGST